MQIEKYNTKLVSERNPCATKFQLQDVGLQCWIPFYYTSIKYRLQAGFILTTQSVAHTENAGCEG